MDTKIFHEMLLYDGNVKTEEVKVFPQQQCNGKRYTEIEQLDGNVLEIHGYTIALIPASIIKNDPIFLTIVNPKIELTDIVAATLVSFGFAGHI
jgi:hypothetical protein